MFGSCFMLLFFFGAIFDTMPSKNLIEPLLGQGPIRPLIKLHRTIFRAIPHVVDRTITFLQENASQHFHILFQVGLLPGPSPLLLGKAEAKPASHSDIMRSHG